MSGFRARAGARSLDTLARVAVRAVYCFLLVACRARQGDALEKAEFGVLFGGDVQDRTRIPLELDATRQELALRVTFREPLSKDQVVAWELERPTAQHSADGGVLYAAEIGEMRAKAGERSAETKLQFRSNDKPGFWRIQARLDGHSILDRRFEVVAPSRGESH